MMKGGERGRGDVKKEVQFPKSQGSRGALKSDDDGEAAEMPQAVQPSPPGVYSDSDH